jgi:protein required for attachment to host cells
VETAAGFGWEMWLVDGRESMVDCGVLGRSGGGREEEAKITQKQENSRKRKKNSNNNNESESNASRFEEEEMHFANKFMENINFDIAFHFTQFYATGQWPTI